MSHVNYFDALYISFSIRAAHIMFYTDSSFFRISVDLIEG